MKVTEPGVYDMPHADYLADPVPSGSLSHSGARRLLPPSCPAKYRYWADNPPTPTQAFDWGHAAHRKVLGAGPDMVVVDADDWRTKAARQARDEAHASGLIPVLAAEYEQITAMAQAILAHPIAQALFWPTTGKPEQSLFWKDEPSGIWRRARLDWLPNKPGTSGRLIIPDYKTTRCADPERLQRAIADYGYMQQAAWYLDGVKALELAEDPVFLFVFQEKDPPYLVTVAETDASALRIGRMLNRRAIDLYAECVANDHWPGYSDEIELIPLPYYVENRYLEDATL